MAYLTDRDIESMTQEIPGGTVKELKKYGTLSKFVPLIVFIKGGYFRNEVNK